MWVGMLGCNLSVGGWEVKGFISNYGTQGRWFGGKVKEGHALDGWVEGGSDGTTRYRRWFT